MMKKEKSCGAVIYRRNEFSKIEFLLIKHKNGGHWGFVKGHVENDETEFETAIREIREETALLIDVFGKKFREVITYNPQENIVKDVVYFLAYSSVKEVKIQEEEVLGFIWAEFDKAYELLGHENNKKILNKAVKFIK